MESREEVTDAANRGGRLLLLIDDRRPLDLLLQVLLTGSTVRHRMPLLRVHRLVSLQERLEVETLATHMACESKQLLVNPLHVCLEVLRIRGSVAASFVWACNASAFVHRPSMGEKIGLIR